MFFLFLLYNKIVHFDKSDYKCTVVNNSLILGVENETISTNLQNIVNIGQTATIDSQQYTVIGLANYAFSKTNIGEIRLPKTIQFIGEGCFFNCTHLKVINLIDTEIKRIEHYTFANCYSLTNLFLPNLLESIGDYAFSSTSFPVLKPFPKSFEYLGEGAFFNCTKLLSLNFSNTKITTFPNNAFRECSKIVQIVFPPNLTVINNGTFYASGIIDNDFPSTLQEIGSFTYSNSFRLNSLDLSKTQIKIISESLFDQSSYLTSVILPKTVQEINANAFKNTALEQIILPKNVSFIGEAALTECVNLKSIDLSETSLTTLSAHLFENCIKLSSVILPKNLKFIDDFCFAGTNFSTFKSPETLESIGNKVFERCPNLKSVDISSLHIKILPQYTFYKCIKLKKFYLPKEITELGEGCFALCHSISYFSFKNTQIIAIGAKAFMKCEQLNQIEFSKLVSSISDEAFHHCEKLTTIDISSTIIVSIGVLAFSNCHNLQSITFPKTLLLIGEKAFEDTSLSEIILPSSLSTLGPKSFSSCKELRSADLSLTSLTSISDQFVYSTALSHVLLPNCMTVIEDNAFSETSLSTIQLPTELERIGDKAFAGTRLTKISFQGTKLSSIGVEAFTRTQLKSIILPETLINLGDSCFESCPSLESANLVETHLTFLPNHLFEDCKELESCILPLTLEKINTSIFSGTIIEKLQIPPLVCNISQDAFEGMEKLSVLEYCGEFELSLPISSLDSNVKVYVMKGYPFKTFATLPTKTTVNCPVNEQAQAESTIQPEVETNGSIVMMTLTVGVIALVVVIFGIMKISAPRKPPTDIGVLLQDQEARL